MKTISNIDFLKSHIAPNVLIVTPLVAEPAGRRNRWSSNRMWRAVWAVLALGFGSSAQLFAQGYTWTGLGGPLWSTAANWGAGIQPPDGADVFFIGDPPNRTNALDFSLSLNALFFSDDAQIFDIHVEGAIGRTLTFTGPGIQNGNGLAASFPFLTADAGAVGATILFTGSSGINLSPNSATFGVAITAAGGAMAGTVGGRVIFQDDSTTGALSFSTLIAEGADAANAGAGGLIFRDRAVSRSRTSLSLRGGTASGASGGMASFENDARLEGNVIVDLGSNGGFGGRLTLRDRAVAAAGLKITNDAAGTPGGEGVTQFLGDSRLTGFVENGGAASAVIGMGSALAGGRLEFHDRASFSNPAGPNAATTFPYVLNLGSAGDQAGGGRTIFYDDSFIAGVNVAIRNDFAGETIVPGGLGGVTEFRDRSRAGSASIFNYGAATNAANTVGAQTIFAGNSTAESASIDTFGGQASGAVGGATIFTGDSFAADATLIARSGTNGGLGGRITFLQSGGGGRARAIVEAGAVLEFTDGFRLLNEIGSLEGAGTFLINNRGLSVGGNGRSTEVSGAIEDSNAHVAPGTFPGGFLQKVGAGTLTVSGASSVTSLSVIEGGLTVNGTFTVSGGFAAVSSGATLAGNGTVGGAVAVANGGIVAPGNLGAGTLTVGPLTLGDTSILNFQLGAVSDRIDVNGALTLDGTLNLSALGGLTAGVYRLLNYTGGFTDNTLAFGTLPAGTNASNFSLQTDVAGQVNLVLHGGAGELLFWDGANVSANGVVNGGSGTWNNVATNWTNSAGSVNQPWAAQKAVFSGAAGTVTLGENVTATGLQFLTNGYVLNGAANAAITLGGSAPIRVENGTTATINAALTGGTLSKDGDGTLILSANNSFAGGTTLANGTLTIRNAAGLGLGTGPVSVLDSPTSTLRFENDALVGAIVITNGGGGPTLESGFVQVLNTSRAGTATFINLGHVGNPGTGSVLRFDNSARAENATIENRGSAVSDPAPIFTFTPAAGGETQFLGTSSAGAAAVTNFGGLASGGGSGRTSFGNSSRAGTATIANPGGQVADAMGGRTVFSGTSSAEQATLTAEGGANGGLGGSIEFRNTSNGSAARVILGAGDTYHGTLDLSALTSTGTSIGSLEGAGTVFLGSKTLSIGGNDLITEFSGGIRDGGAAGGVGGRLLKGGGATLTLAGDSSYSGGTSVFDGTLRITNPNGRGLGSGAVVVQATATSELRFSLTASAGAVAITNGGSITAAYAGATTFRSSASAGSASILNSASLANGGLGGYTEFYASARAGSAAFDNRGSAFLGNANGAGGGNLAFLESSQAGTATIVNRGGIVNGANGGRTTFEGASLGGAATITNLAAVVQGAAPGTTHFRSGASAEGATIGNAGAGGFGFTGGRTDFFDAASAGAATITNAAGAAGDAGAGVTAFSGLSKAGTARITNAGSGVPKAFGGLLGFNSGASAERATIINLGASTAQGPTGFSLRVSAGYTQFFPSSTAGFADITNSGGLANGASGGTTEFADGSSAGQATVLNQRGAASGGGAGVTTFSYTAVAGTSTVTNEGAQGSGSGGVTEFYNTSNAGAAGFFNGATLSGGFSGGRTRFFDASRAGTATFDNEGARANRANAADTVEAGEVNFRGSSSADAATIANRGKTIAGGVTGGSAVFFQSTRGGTATIVNEGSAFASSPDPAGGWTRFLDSTSAEQATITNRAALSATGAGGTTHFNGVAATPTADRATITNQGGIVSGGSGGSTAFLGTSRGGTATFTNEAGTVSGAFGGLVSFAIGSSAESARLTNRGGAVGGAGAGSIRFDGGTAGNAVIVNEAAAAALAGSGSIEFRNVGTNAGSASIMNLGAAVSGAAGAQTLFSLGANAGTATITAAGGSAPGAGAGTVVFNQNSTAGAATLIAEGGTNGGNGGTLLFAGTSSGGNLARIIVNAGGAFDISNLNSTSLVTGSIEGAGNIFLGNKLLLVGDNNRAGEVTGVIADNGAAVGAGGRLYKVGTGPLTLSGANTYTGGTTIGNGFAANSGKIIATNLSGSATGPGPVLIQRGGTLGGSGNIGGPVTLKAGGAIIPGDPVTLTLEDTLTWDGGSTIRLALGPDQAGSDQLVIGGALIRGDTSGGAFTIDLENFGAVVGQTYDFLHFDSIQGFTAADFAFTGAVTGDLFLSNGTLGVVVTNVPEPGAGGLLGVASVFLFGLFHPRRWKQYR